MVPKDGRQIRRAARYIGHTLRSRAPQSSCARPSADSVAVPLGEVRDREHVGNAASAADFFGGPGATGGLEYDRPRRVGDQKAVVIGEAAILVTAAASLPVRLNQTDNQ